MKEIKYVPHLSINTGEAITGCDKMWKICNRETKK